jgi:hypothetical protein
MDSLQVKHGLIVGIQSKEHM